MANLSDLTRREQVLRYLEDRLDQWVDGTELATEKVGGSEGLKRLRELRQDGHIIKMRAHPDRTRSIFQYRLLPKQEVHSRVVALEPPASPASPPPISPIQPKTVKPVEPMVLHYNQEHDEYEIIKLVCVDCEGLYEDEEAHQADPQHIAWTVLNAPDDEQQDLGVKPPTEVHIFKRMPAKIEMGSVALCPRCKGLRRGQIRRFDKKLMDYRVTPAEEFTRDPYKPTIGTKANLCPRCNGLGIVPAIGV